MLFDEAAVLTALSILWPESFAQEAHQKLFGAMLALHRRAVKVDHITLRDELLRREHLDLCGGLQYLAELVDAVPTAAHVEFHAAIVQDYALRRHLSAQAQAALTLAHDHKQPIQQSVSAIVDKLVRIGQPANPEKELRSELWEVLGEVERQARSGDAITGVSRGIRALDELTDGWEKGRLIIVAARPKIGKTRLALHFAREASRAESPVYFATAEQPRRELVKRLLGMEAGCSLRAIRSEQLLDMSVAGLARAATEIASWPLVIDHRARTPAQIRLGVQRYVAEKGPLGLVVADYLGKYHSGEKSERHDLEIARMTGAFAQLAIDLDVPVILPVQLNRQSVQGGQARRPTPSDLRDSGASEQDCAQLLFLYRDEKAEKAARDPNWLQVIVELNRFGPTGATDVVFEKTTGRWTQSLRLAS